MLLWAPNTHNIIISSFRLLNMTLVTWRNINFSLMASNKCLSMKFVILGYQYLVIGHFQESPASWQDIYLYLKTIHHNILYIAPINHHVHHLA
jgi:hypothetical protein